MKSFSFFRIIFFIIFSCAIIPAKGSHGGIGVNFQYEVLNQNKVVIELVWYHGTSGFGLNSVNIMESSSCSNQTLSLPLRNTNYDSLRCLQSKLITYRYSDTVTLNPACGSFTYIFTGASAYSGPNYSGTVNTSMHIADVSIPHKSSRFINYPKFSASVGELNYPNWEAEAEVGDSLVWALDSARGSYSAPYSKNSPFSQTMTPNLDSQTGFASFISDNSGYFMSCIQVAQYRNGVLLGSINRSASIYMFQVPQAINVINWFNFPANTNLCAGDSITLFGTFNSSNPSLNLQAEVRNKPGAFITQSGNTIAFVWKTDSNEYGNHHILIDFLYNSCTHSTALINFQTDSCISTALMENENKAEFDIYPNPSSDVLWVDCKVTDLTFFRLIDIQGKVCLNQTIQGRQMLNVSHLPAGIYFAQIGAKSKKIQIR